MGAGNGMLSRLGRWTLAGLAPALVFIFIGLGDYYQVDFWHHIGWGRATVTQGQFLTNEEVTCTVPGRSLISHSWLTEVLYYCLYSRGGLDLVYLLNALTLAAVLALLVFLCARASGSLPLASAMGIFVSAGLWQLFTLRPQSFSLLCFAGVQTLLTLAASRRWLLALVPVVVGLWANLHGAYPVGLLLIGTVLLAAAFDAGRAQGWGVLRDRSTLALVLCLLASVLATLATPYGWELYRVVNLDMASCAARGIQEWQPAGVTPLYGLLFTASIVLALVALALPGRQPTTREIALLVVFLPLACSAIRMIPWWYLACMPTVTACFAAGLPRSWVEDVEPERAAPINGVAFGLLALLVVACAPGVARHVPFVQDWRGTDPTRADLDEATRQLRQIHPAPAHIYSRYEWGEYLGWLLAPEGYRIFMDSRVHIYPDSVWSDYLALLAGRTDWQEILDRYQVSCMILDLGYSSEKENLLPLVERSKNWREVGRVGNAVVFVRSPHPP